MVGEREQKNVGGDQDNESVAATAESLLTFENAALALSVVSPEGNVIMANRAMRALLGFEFTDLIGKSVFDLVVGEASDVTQAWADRLGGEAHVTRERAVDLRCADGGELSVRVSSVLVTDGQGAARYVVCQAIPERV